MTPTSRRRWPLLLGAATAMAFCAAWWTWRAPDGPINVVLITLDTLRADRLGSYGYVDARTPHLDALAAAGVRLTDAVSASPITGPAHAGLLTGRYPARLGVRDNATTPLPEAAETLAETLSAHGYESGGFVGAFILDRPYGFAQGFQTFDGFATVQSGDQATAERRGDVVMDAALQWLASRSPDRPFFLWVHLYDSHAPYDAPAPYGEEFSTSPYDGEIAFTDAQVGRLLEALRASGHISRTVVAALADHGESLGEHGEDEHGVFLYEPVVRIPWMMAGPGIRSGRVVTEQVRSVDLVPTLLGALSLPVPSGLDGVDLMPVLGGTARPAPPPAFAESYYPRLHYGWSELRSVRADGWKAIDAPRPELYNLRDDPGETRNLYDAQRPLADRMIAEAVRLDRELTGALRPSSPAPVPAPDRQTLERLRSLGYVGTSSAAPTHGERGADPKDRIDERRKFQVLMSEAIDDLRARRTELAIDKFKQLVAINRQSYDLHQMLGEAYQTLGRLREALGEYEYAALLGPGVASPRLAAAEVHLALKDVRAARTRRDEAAALDPTSFDVSLVTGRILEAEGRPEEALSAYERAVAQNGANPRPRMLLVGVASRLERYDIAESQLRSLLTMGYQPSRTHFALGRLAHLRGRLDEAGRHYREALRLEPGLPMAVEGLRMIGR
ncbi:MAG: sulfatase-like hydrolase/transferase [Acidobacteria bacterium]|nr:sulfatase-like hydrolase/transferase [Acidobacteriota bacterium]